jgi:large subunit ribosomal protein L31
LLRPGTGGVSGDTFHNQKLLYAEAFCNHSEQFARPLTFLLKSTILTPQEMGKETNMKAGIHPDYQTVVFKDGLTGTMFLSRSTMKSKETVKYTDGNEYPLIVVDISSASHPFYTGQQQLVDTAGRVERFKRKYNIKG